MNWLRNWLGLNKDRVAMPQSQEQIEQRALQDRLIDEHRRANAQALKELRVEAPRMANRYIDAMGHAMTIMREGVK